MLIKSTGKSWVLCFLNYTFATMKHKLIFLPAVLTMIVLISCGDNSNTQVQTTVTAKDTTLVLPVASTGNTGTKCDSIQKKVDSLLNKK
jgi:hypothetical protein